MANYVKHLNEVRLRGKVVNGPVLREFNGGALVCNMSIVTDKSRKGEDGKWEKESEFHELTIWNNDNCRSVKKGDIVEVVGTIKTQKWTDRNTNEDRSKKVIMCDDIIIVTFPSGNASVSSGYNGEDCPV